jgi:predicted membrane channel-forming protein YqfA (hemolysin III family)
MSSDVAILWKKIDVIGIFVVSVFLTFSLSYFVFTWTITLAVTFVSASIGTIASFKIARHKYTPGSVERFAHTTGVGVVVLVYMSPVVYITVIEWKYGMPLVTFIIVSISLILGGVVFANHWPECKYPRKFDIIGCSQTIMHILLIVAHLAEFLFVLDMFYAKHGHARLLN